MIDIDELCKYKLAVQLYTCCCCVGRGGDCVAAATTKHSCYTDSTIATSIERGNGVGSDCSINIV